MPWSVQDGGDGQMHFSMPSWAWPIFAADAVLLLPIWFIISYTILYIYPVFTIIENENPPAYDPVALPSSEDPIAEDANGSTNKLIGGDSRTVTSSLRSIHRLLTSHGGWTANFRGLFCAFVQSALTRLVTSFFSWGPAKPFATLFAELTLVQYAAAWVHIVISHPNPRQFWRRLPSFKRAFEATWQPTVIYWAATQLQERLPSLAAHLMGLDAPFSNDLLHWDPKTIDAIKHLDVVYLLKVAGYLIMLVALYFLVVIPARVVLVRVQASLLPPEEDTIIPFDRSFEGKIEPAVLGGRGHATIKDAWSTFSGAGWRRVIVLHVKIFAITSGLMFLTWAILIPELFLILVAGIKKPGV